MPLVYALENPSALLAKLRRNGKILAKAVISEDDTAVGDAIFDFAVTGYHIRDWLAQTSNLGPEVDEFVAASSELQACRDICNSSKHYQVNRYIPKTKDVYFSALPLRESSLQIKGAVKILMSDGEKFEVTEFATKVIERWEKFFAEYSVDAGT